MQVLRWVACSCDRGMLLWLPEFTSGPHGTARSSPFGQLLEITTGGCRSVVADGEGQLPAISSHTLVCLCRRSSVAYPLKPATQARQLGRRQRVGLTPLALETVREAIAPIRRGAALDQFLPFDMTIAIVNNQGPPTLQHYRESRR